MINYLVDPIIDKSELYSSLKKAKKIALILYKTHKNYSNYQFDTNLVLEILSVDLKNLSLIFNIKQQQKLIPIINQIKEINQSDFQEWWKENGKIWNRKFIMASKCENLDHDFSLNSEQENLLKQYYKANQFLLECLSNNCYINQSLRNKIYDSLLLPFEDDEYTLIG